MSRPCGFRVAWTAVLVLAAACQNYNFNPVGRCIMQPGKETITLSNISTADVLFVIDDSGSMAAEQDRLATNFNAFITNLDQTNVARVDGGLKAIDFHLAVTTTSVFYNYVSTAATWTCKATCGAASNVCCVGPGYTVPVKAPRACTQDAQCGGGNVRCLETCRFTYQSPPYGPFDLLGEKYCCDQTTLVAPLLDNVPCSVPNATCGTFERHYDFGPSCQAGVATDGHPFPRGGFVGAGTNPRVLHFDKGLYEAGGGTNRQGFTSAQLVDFFRGNPVGTNANVKVGTCGSGEEQGLEAARLAVQKALAGQQLDTYSIAGAQTPSPAEWPHPSSKLVLVFVGDEDDCSSPDTDPSSGIVLLSTDSTGTNDACTRNDGLKQFDVVSRYVDYFMGLDRPVGAAFIASFVGGSSQSVCSWRDGVGDCTAARCCQENCPSAGTCGTTGSPDYCGGQGPGSRFFTAASEFSTRGADVVMGSICDARFDLLLNEIADILKLPSGLELPTLPAEGDITVLRIAEGERTVKLCDGPLPPKPGVPPAPDYTLAEAQQVVNPTTGAVYDWWFTATADDGPPVEVSRFVYINPAGACKANAGETYSAEYIGRLPAEGCHTDDECRTKLGGTAGAWTCYAGTEISGGVEMCKSTATATGTCLCGSLATNCPNGKLP